jgi:hypothetical protein
MKPNSVTVMKLSLSLLSTAAKEQLNNNLWNYAECGTINHKRHRVCIKNGNRRNRATLEQHEPTTKRKIKKTILFWLDYKLWLGVLVVFWTFCCSASIEPFFDQFNRMFRFIPKIHLTFTRIQPKLNYNAVKTILLWPHNKLGYKYFGSIAKRIVRWFSLLYLWWLWNVQSVVASVV